MAAAKPKLPPQIVRLVLLTVGIVGSYLVARYFLTPSSFGQYGFYRGQALEEVKREEGPVRRPGPLLSVL